MKKIFFMAALLLTFYACNNSDSKTVPPKKGSSGKTLELMVVANKDVYVGETKEFIDSMFGSPQPCLIVPESKFDIVNIPKTSFENTEMFHNYRNVLLLDINQSMKARYLTSFIKRSTAAYIKPLRALRVMI